MALVTNLVSYWKLEGNSNDAVGSNNGTDTGITYSSGNGKITQGAGLNNASSSIVVARNANMESTTYSFGGWFKPAALSNEILLSKNYTTSNTTPFMSYQIRVTSSTSLRFDGNAGGTYYNFSVTTPTMSVGTYYFVVVTYGSNTVTVYFNGSSVGTSSQSAPTFGGNGTFVIGNDIVGTGMAGAMDECFYYSKELTSAEVTLLYNGGTGFQYPFTTAYTITASIGIFLLTGYAAVVGRLITLVTEVTKFSVIGWDTVLDISGWFRQNRNSASYSNSNKNTASFGNQSKASSTWTNQNEN